MEVYLRLNPKVKRIVRSLDSDDSDEEDQVQIRCRPEVSKCQRSADLVWQNEIGTRLLALPREEL